MISHFVTNKAISAGWTKCEFYLVALGQVIDSTDDTTYNPFYLDYKNAKTTEEMETALKKCVEKIRKNGNLQYEAAQTPPSHNRNYIDYSRYDYM